MLTIGVSSVGTTSHTPSLAITTSAQSSSIVISKTSSQSGRITPGVPPSSSSFKVDAMNEGTSLGFCCGDRTIREGGREVGAENAPELRRILVYKNSNGGGMKTTTTTKSSSSSSQDICCRIYYLSAQLLRVSCYSRVSTLVRQRCPVG